MKGRNKNKQKGLVLLLLVLTVSIGYAALASTLKINGNTVVKGLNWSIYWDNVVPTTGSVTGANVVTAPTTVGTSTRTINFSVILPEPGDFYEFEVDAVNAGTIDAMIADEGIITKAYSDANYTNEVTLPDVVRYTVTYQDGTAVEERDLLPKRNGDTPTRKTYKVRVEYRNDSEIDPEDLDGENDRQYYLRFEVEYVQAENTSSGGDEPEMVCKKATTLHTEICDRTAYGCYASGYIQGSAKGTTVTYGHTDSSKLVNGELTNGISGGYALDCDVSGNGDYERFYYVSDLYTGTIGGVDQFDNDYAVLIYHKNTGTVGKGYYSESGVRENWHGPVTLLSNLPDRTTWPNEKIGLKTTTRTIVNELGTETTNAGSNTIANPFTYTDRVGRLLTVQEINKSCNITVGNSTDGELAGCEYLMEDSEFAQGTDCSGGACYYWLENPRSSVLRVSWFLSGGFRSVNGVNVGVTRAVRPVIEVKKTDISLN